MATATLQKADRQGWDKPCLQGVKRRILVVDDDPGVLQALGLLFDTLEAEVATFTDPIEALERFESESFDLVVSSECIEHTPDPGEALRQMAGVLRPGGYLSVSTPNLLWQPVVRTASRLRLRVFDGYEKFSTRRSMTHALEQGGVRVVRAEGLHLFPFQLGLHGLSRWCDRHLQSLRAVMINICLLGRKD